MAGEMAGGSQLRDVPNGGRVDGIGVKKLQLFVFCLDESRGTGRNAKNSEEKQTY